MAIIFAASVFVAVKTIIMPTIAYERKLNEITIRLRERTPHRV